MKQIYCKYTAFILMLLMTLITINVKGQNLLTNGGFESGGNGVGFNLNGAGYNLITAPFSGTTSAGDYAFTNNPFPMNTANFIAGGDHTSGTGLMMVIDGNNTGGNQRFWRAGNSGGGVCGLTIGTTYTFSYWIKSVSTTVVDAATSANIGVQFNNSSTSALVSGTTQAPLPASGWQQVVYTFVASNTCVNIELWNTNTSFVGNDFAVDDFSVTAPCINPTSPPILFCDVPNPAITPPPASFDFNNVGQTSFTYTYTIEGGAPVTGTFVAPSHYDVTGVSQGQAVTFTLTWDGICTPSQTITCYPPCVTPVTPTFTQVSAICSGQALAALPTTSLNGVQGTWSPALNNLATTTYTFTPIAAGECGTTTQMTITVNPIVTPTFTQVASICSGATLSALPTTSNNGISGTWSPALNNTATTTYTFTPNAGQCATTAQMTITVNPNVTPTFTQVAPICSGAILSPLPTTSNNGITGSWSPALNNTATTTYTFTPTTGQCATTVQMTINVSSNITPTFTVVAPICSGGILAPLPITSNNGINGTWSPAMNNTATTTYTFTPNVGQCATTTQLTVTVNPNVTPTFTQRAPICSGGILTPLPTTSNNGISGTWSPALNNTATTTYTFTPNVGQCATSATMQIVVYPTSAPTLIIQQSCASNTVTITDPVGPNYEYSLDGQPYQPNITYSNLTTGNHTIVAHQITANCFTSAANFAIVNVVNDVVVFNPAPLQICDTEENDGIQIFDLTQVESFVTGGNTYDISYHETITDAQVDATFIPNPSAYTNIYPSNQTIYIRVQSTTSTCFEVVPLQLIVHPKPTAVEPTDLHECDNGDALLGFTVFNLTDKASEILGP
ncbi:MAG: hypothetical protein J0L86_15625, partial [Flavobacteriales bacterium]|nr:hypothetical protein [Flavobacteriales bacterium]